MEIWYGAMTAREHWLWPRVAGRPSHGAVTYVFATIDGEVVEHVRHDPQADTATWVGRVPPGPRRATGQRIDDEMLLAIPYR
jgi:hypothetical protein